MRISDRVPDRLAVALADREGGEPALDRNAVERAAFKKHRC
jgi:hypothetical protein